MDRMARVARVARVARMDGMEAPMTQWMNSSGAVGRQAQGKGPSSFGFASFNDVGQSRVYVALPAPRDLFNQFRAFHTIPQIRRRLTDLEIANLWFLLGDTTARRNMAFNMVVNDPNTDPTARMLRDYAAAVGRDRAINEVRQLMDNEAARIRNAPATRPGLGYRPAGLIAGDGGTGRPRYQRIGLGHNLYIWRL